MTDIVTKNGCPWIFNDGSRAESGYRGRPRDCVTRAITIASGLPYQEVYDALAVRAKAERLIRKRRSPREGVFRTTYEPYLFDLGFVWHSTMSIGSGTRVHLRPDELPSGRLVVAVSKHMCAVINGVVHDTHDPTRDGMRAVYGFYERTA